MSTPASLRELFEQAVRLSPSERVAFIDASRADGEMRERLLRMCAADAVDNDAIAATDASVAADLLGDPEIIRNLPRGSRIGPFELVDVLGEGGSSTVFRASREIEGVRQEVALKLLRRGLYSPEAQRQFRRERIALSQLRHPGIARLIEGGVSKDGVAFIALDLVDGMPVNEYAREHRLDLRARLGLFLQICRAVEAAHRALIVHRDLKPSNVLVTTDAQVKLLDFGIAKLLDADDETRTQLPAFTPAYAAPEQRSGAPVTTATDVYALGILLGELVTGERLNDGSGRTPSGQINDASEPGVLPATPKATRRQLRGDLDNIVLKAIENEPLRRYVSAGAFADDIERLLDGQPVAAHPPSRWYRTRKFIARHKGSVISTAAFLLAILAAMAMALWQAQVASRQAQIAREQLRRANAQALRAEQVKSTLLGLFNGLDPSVAPEKRPTLEQIFESGISDLRADAGIEPDLRVELMAISGHVLHRIGHAQRGLDLVGEAVAFGETHAPPDSEATLGAIATLSHMDYLDGRLDVADARLKAAFARAGGETVASPARMDILTQLGAIARSKSDLKGAVAYLEMARTMHDRVFPSQLDDAAFSIRGELGSTYFQMSRFAQAAMLQRESFEQARQRYGAEDESTARFMGDLADSLNKLGHWGEAMSLLRQSAEYLRRSLPAPNQSFASWLYSMGWVFADQRQWNAAAKVFAESNAIMIARFGADAPLAFGPRAWLAQCWTQAGRASEAKDALVKMLARQQAQPESSPRMTALLQLLLGNALLKLDQADLARDHAKEALALHRQLYGQDNSRTLAPMNVLARSLAALGDGEGALAQAHEAQRIAQTELDRGNPARMEIALLLGDLQHADPAQARAHYGAVIEEAAAAPERPLALLTEAHADLADLATAAGNGEEATRERGLAQELQREAHAQEQEQLADLDRWLAQGLPYK